MNLTPQVSKIPAKDGGPDLYGSWIQQAINLESSNLDSINPRQAKIKVQERDRAASQ